MAFIYRGKDEEEEEEEEERAAWFMLEIVQNFPLVATVFYTIWTTFIEDESCLHSIGCLGLLLTFEE